MAETLRFTFKKQERLTHPKIIERIFQKEGQTKRLYPFRIIWLETKLPVTDYPAQVCISVPSKYVRKAVNRNKIKRHLREAYRLNKHLFYEVLQKGDVQIALMIIYVGKKDFEPSFIRHKLAESLQFLISVYENN